MNIQRKIITNTRNYKFGRDGRNVEFIVIHTYGGGGVSLYNWFQNNQVQVSAHYAVRKDGIIEQYVEESNTAYHAGNWEYNLKSIGIEHQDDNNWNDAIRTNELYEASAQLIADIFRRYNWGIQEWDRRIVLHRTIPGVRAECPGGLNIERLRLRVSELLEPQWKKQFVRQDRRYITECITYLYNHQTGEKVAQFPENSEIITHYVNHSNEWVMTEYSYLKNVPNGFKVSELEYKKPVIKEEPIIEQQQEIKEEVKEIQEEIKQEEVKQQELKEEIKTEEIKEEQIKEEKKENAKTTKFKLFTTILLELYKFIVQLIRRYKK
jgi:gas vesicle protein